MPYESALALAANFCWDIRHALTPIFGPEFLAMCLTKDDPNYGTYIINRAIVNHNRDQYGLAPIPDPNAAALPAAIPAPAAAPQSALGVSTRARRSSSPPLSPKSTGVAASPWAAVNDTPRRVKREYV